MAGRPAVTSQIAWLSFDAEQQRRTQLLMNALAGRSTIDELGLGPFRDLISSTVNPHLTVLHRRARYLIFLPGIYSNLSGSSAESVFREGRNREALLAQRLATHYAESSDSDSVGIIGRIAGAEATQPASVAFWGLLRSLGILKSDVSVFGYSRAVAEQRASIAAISGLHDENHRRADPNSMWIDLAGLDGAKPSDDPTSFDLTASEARFLQDQFLEMDSKRPEDERSLTSWLLDPDRQSWCQNVAYAWQHPESDQFPSATGTIVEYGRQIDHLAHSARIVYNYLCDQGCPAGARRDELLQRAEEEFDVWLEDVESIGIPDRRIIDEIDDWVRSILAARRVSIATQQRWQRTYQFLRTWSELSISTGDALLNDSEAAGEVKKREVLTKGVELARLTNRTRLRSWDSHSGLFHLDFNWSVVDRILLDIHRGLGTEMIDAAVP